MAKALPHVIGALVVGIAIGRGGTDTAKAPEYSAPVSAAALPPVTTTTTSKTESRPKAERQTRQAERPRPVEPVYDEPSYDAPMAAYDPPPASGRSSTYSGGAFANCSAARAAGAAPVRAGDPGYSRRLDRDGDGVGCE